MEASTDVEVSPGKNSQASCSKPEKSWQKKLLSFLASYLGLFVLLVLYVVGGAYLFFQRESQIELEMYNQMMKNHRKAFHK